ncbi:MAG: HEAT repeat domain-containing protein [Armatimonadetes bacterium]|nr:HEAT repeat domain-containing protein [Armatimonadota bacterium]
MDDAAIRRWVQQIDDPVRALRTEAAHRLAEIGEEAVPYLREILLADDPDYDHAEYAVWILEQIDTPAAEALLEAWWDRQ